MFIFLFIFPPDHSYLLCQLATKTGKKINITFETRYHKVTDKVDSIDFALQIQHYLRLILSEKQLFNHCL